MDTSVRLFLDRFSPPPMRPAMRQAGLAWAAWCEKAALLPAWSGLLLAAVVLAGWLLAFHQVVHGAVLQGESRRQATAALISATWRCNALRSPDAAGACLARLAVPTDAALAAGGRARPAVLPAPVLPSDGAATDPGPQSRSGSTDPATARIIQVRN